MVQQTCTDQQIRRAAEGSSADLNALLAAVEPGVRRLIAGRLGVAASHPATDDIAQDVMFAVSSSLGRLQTPSPTGLWKYIGGIVAHKVADHIVVKGKHPARLDSAVGDAPTCTALRKAFLAEPRGPGTHLAWRDDVDDLARAIEGLTPGHRDVLIMAFVQHLSTAQIGHRLGVSRPAASMLVVRAVRSLRRSLTGSSHLQS